MRRIFHSLPYGKRHLIPHPAFSTSIQFQTRQYPKSACRDWGRACTPTVNPRSFWRREQCSVRNRPRHASRLKHLSFCLFRKSLLALYDMLGETTNHIQDQRRIFDNETCPERRRASPRRDCRLLRTDRNVSRLNRQHIPPLR